MQNSEPQTMRYSAPMQNSEPQAMRNSTPT
jgi:hypothetical protein